TAGRVPENSIGTSTAVAASKDRVMRRAENARNIRMGHRHRRRAWTFVRKRDCKKLVRATTTFVGGDSRSMPRDDAYEDVATTFGAAIDRLARSYEADAEKRRDLLQDIHFAIWRSLRK